MIGDVSLSLAFGAAKMVPDMKLLGFISYNESSHSMLQVFESFLSILPLYIISALGFIAGKFFRVDRQSIVSIILYILTPVIFFDAGYAVEIKDVTYVVLPLVLFSISGMLCIVYWNVAKCIWTDRRINLTAFSAGTSNTGYFGMAAAMMFFDSNLVALYMFIVMGVSIYEYTIGAYVMAIGSYSAAQAIKKVLTLPMVYTFILGVICSAFNVQVSESAYRYIEYTRGAYVILGMMLIGISLSTLQYFIIDWRFVMTVLSSKFVISPLVAGCLIFIDKTWLQIYPSEVYKIILFLSAMPPAVNTVVFATIYNHHYSEAAVTVLMGLILAAVFVPVVIYIL